MRTNTDYDTWKTTDTDGEIADHAADRLESYTEEAKAAIMADPERIAECAGDATAIPAAASRLAVMIHSRDRAELEVAANAFIGIIEGCIDIQAEANATRRIYAEDRGEI